MNMKNQNTGINDFDWSIYEDGYTGGDKLVINKKVKSKKGVKVYCHEAYAQSLYDAMEAHFNGQSVPELTAKDERPGTIYQVTNITAVSNHEVAIDTTSGMSSVIDLNKEKQYLETLGCANVGMFTDALNLDNGFKCDLLTNGLTARVSKTGRISLWDGHKAKIEQEFKEQIVTPTCAYYGLIESINNGGYIVNVNGIKCFMPGSLAAAGVITDFNSMIGKTVPVMIINYLPKTGGFVVSYKKYLNTVLPQKIENELSVGMSVMCKVTGTSTNGVFLLFKDNAGDYVFSGLIHRSTMSKDFEYQLDHRMLRNGDEFHAYISSINYIESEHKYRIVLTDDEALVPKKSDDSEASQKS